jgi:hypothetical protein
MSYFFVLLLDPPKECGAILTTVAGSSFFLKWILVFCCLKQHLVLIFFKLSTIYILKHSLF